MTKKITARLLLMLAVLCAATAYGADQADRPNIVSISLEDLTPMMGCYGDDYTRTPEERSVPAGLNAGL